jgi:hypothetical protein
VISIHKERATILCQNLTRRLCINYLLPLAVIAHYIVFYLSVLLSLFRREVLKAITIRAVSLWEFYRSFLGLSFSICVRRLLVIGA